MRGYFVDNSAECEFYPEIDDGPVCWAGSDVSGLRFWCTKKNSLECQWAKMQRELEGTNENTKNKG